MKISKIKKKFLKKIRPKSSTPRVVHDQWNEVFDTPQRPLAGRLVVGTTFRCAARCPHCYLLQQNHGVFSNQSDMDNAFFEQLLESPYTRNLKSIVFTGGEALLNAKVFDWMDYADRRGIPEIRIVSNGLPLQSPDIVDKLIGKECLGSINISIDSITREGYCRAKGIKQCNFQEICEQIQRIANHFEGTKTKVSGSFVLQKLAPDNARDIITFAQSIGLRKVQLTTFHNAQSEGHTSAQTSDDAQLLSAIDGIVSHTDYQADVMIQLPSAFARHRFFCHSLAGYLCVGPHGHLAPCCHMPWDAKYGQFKASTQNPINHPAIAAMREQFIQAAVAGDLGLLPEQCRYCNKRTPGNVLMFKADTRQWQKKIPPERQACAIKLGLQFNVPPANREAINPLVHQMVQGVFR